MKLCTLIRDIREVINQTRTQLLLGGGREETQRILGRRRGAHKGLWEGRTQGTSLRGNRCPLAGADLHN